MNDDGRSGGARVRARDVLFIGLAGALVTLLLMAFVSCSHAREGDAGASHPAAAVLQRPSPPAETPLPRDDARLKAMIRRMTAAEKVGQLFMVSFYGGSPGDQAPYAIKANVALTGLPTAAAMVSRYDLGGVIYMGSTGNVQRPRQVAELSNGLQRVATGSHPGIPLLVATDQEGGAVSRIPAPATQVPGNMALGADGREADAYAAAQATGSELRAMGVNMVLAPVADVNVDPKNAVIGVRSFGGDPELVASLTYAAVSGYRSAGIAATAKHFPGHGDTHVDSHVGLPVLSRTVRQLQRIDLPPFRAAIAAGVDAVMVGHLAAPSLDPSGKPASLSHDITTRWLRGRLGFKGVIITDALAMSGAMLTSSPEDVALRAFRAGADILLMPPQLGPAYSAVLRAVRDGRIAKKRIDASVLRILRLKQRLGVLADPLVARGALRSEVSLSSHRALAARIAARSITLVKSRPGTLPLRSGDRVLVTGDRVRAVALLAKELSGDGVKVRMLAARAPISHGLVAEAVGLARNCDAVVVATNDVRSAPSQRALVAAVSACRRRVAVVSLGDPQDIARLPGVGTYLAAYNDRAPSLKAIADALAGRVAITGLLPVVITAPGSSDVLYALGTGLQHAAVTP
jgi:beta-N-acetylhexosaminidase